LKGLILEVQNYCKTAKVTNQMLNTNFSNNKQEKSISFCHRNMSKISYLGINNTILAVDYQ